MSGSGSYSNNNSGVSATAGGDRTVDRTTSVNSGCGSSNSGGGGGSNSNSGGGGFDGWDSRQQLQRDRSSSSSSRVDYRAERTANSDVLRGTGNIYNDVVAVVAAVPSGSNRSSCLTPLSPSDSERGSYHGHGHDGSVNGIARGSLTDVHADRRDRSDRSRGAREERNRERESRNRSSIVSDATIYGETSNSAPAYVDNASGTAMTSLSTDGFERLRSTGQYLDYRT